MTEVFGEGDHVLTDCECKQHRGKGKIVPGVIVRVDHVYRSPYAIKTECDNCSICFRSVRDMVRQTEVPK